MVSGSSNIMLISLIFIYIFTYPCSCTCIYTYILTGHAWQHHALLKKLKTSVKVMQAFIELTTDHHAYPKPTAPKAQLTRMIIALVIQPDPRN